MRARVTKSTGPSSLFQQREKIGQSGTISHKNCLLYKQVISQGPALHNSLLLVNCYTLYLATKSVLEETYRINVLKLLFMRSNSTALLFFGTMCNTHGELSFLQLYTLHKSRNFFYQLYVLICEPLCILNVFLQLAYQDRLTHLPPSPL